MSIVQILGFAVIAWASFMVLFRAGTVDEFMHRAMRRRRLHDWNWHRQCARWHFSLYEIYRDFYQTSPDAQMLNAANENSEKARYHYAKCREIAANERAPQGQGWRQ